MRYAILALLMFSQTAFGALDNHLTSVSVEENAGKTMIHFDFSKAAGLANVETRFIRRTVEWDVNNTGIKKDKLFREIGAADINNVYVSHNDEKSIRIRINFDNGKMASNYHERISFTQKDKRMTLTIDGGIPLIANNIKELSRVYEFSAAAPSKIALTTTLNADAGEEAIPTSAAAAAGKTAGDKIDDNKSESEIPLTTAASGAKAAAANPLKRVFIGIGVLSLMLVSVVFVGKRLNQKRTGAPFNHDSIKVISQKFLGSKRNLTLVRVSGEYLLLGVTDHNISLIKALSVVDDEIPELTPNDFGDTVKQLTKKAAADFAMDEAPEDSFSVSSLSDVKNIMRKRKYIDESDY